MDIFRKLCLVGAVLVVFLLVTSFCVPGRKEEDEMAEEPKLLPVIEESAETIDWTEAMILAVTHDDVELGYMAEGHLVGVGYDDLQLLSLFMTAMWRPGWAPEWQSAVGEVIINRMASREFEGRTVRDVLFSPEGGRDFPVVRSAGWDHLTPDRRTVRRALELLRGRRVLNDPQIVYIGAAPNATGWYYQVLVDASGSALYLSRTTRPQLYA